MRTKLVFSLRQSLEKPLSVSWFYIANASVSNPLDLPTAATSSSNIENTLDPRAGRTPENTFCEHDNSRRRLYGSTENNINIRDHSKRGERLHPRKIADKRWRDASSSSDSKRRQAPLSLKGCNFFSSVSGRLYNRTKRSGNSSASINERLRMIDSACLRKLIFYIISLYLL